jgi:hypothetical protein
MIDWTISLGAILSGAFNAIVLMAGAISFYYAIKYMNKMTAAELKVLSGDVTELKTEIKDLTKVVTIQAVQDEKILAANQALAAFRGEYNERHKSLRDRVERIEAAVFYSDGRKRE